MTHGSPEAVRFSCTPGGAIAAGIRRLTGLLSVLALLMLVAAIVAWLDGKVVPGLLALVVAGIVLLAWRMSGELRPQSLELKEGLLEIETARQTIEIPLENATIRKLESAEIEHLERLASAGGFVAGSGGFDSTQLGEFDLYASDFAHSLFIQAFGYRLVVTPDRPEDFVDCFHRMAALPPATIHSP